MSVGNQNQDSAIKKMGRSDHINNSISMLTQYKEIIVEEEHRFHGTVRGMLSEGQWRRLPIVAAQVMKRKLRPSLLPVPAGIKESWGQWNKVGWQVTQKIKVGFLWCIHWSHKKIDFVILMWMWMWFLKIGYSKPNCHNNYSLLLDHLHLLLLLQEWERESDVLSFSLDSRSVCIKMVPPSNDILFFFFFLLLSSVSSDRAVFTVGLCSQPFNEPIIKRASIPQPFIFLIQPITDGGKWWVLSSIKSPAFMFLLLILLLYIAGVLFQEVMKRKEMPSFGNWEYYDEIPVHGYYYKKDVDLFKVPVPRSPVMYHYHNKVLT